jgi:hypothetical protein
VAAIGMPRCCTCSYVNAVVFQCWLQIYKPDEPNGKRFTKTGAKTKIARLYHATSILTKDGDILIVSSTCYMWHIVSKFGML